MQRYTVYFIWKLLYMFRGGGGTITHNQELRQLYLQHLATHSTLKPVPTLPR